MKVIANLLPARPLPDPVDFGRGDRRAGSLNAASGDQDPILQALVTRPHPVWDLQVRHQLVPTLQVSADTAVPQGTFL